ncbi:hypothetical protein LRS03_21995 [Rhizobacter sp. J219]|uniref:hypothetical protein n=1 Tax=Rhizobacter sp. J219 TaxID=2898430 RepID=UPI0021516BF2|nr:hypothetical protein [Rhizobacter sp. J219]MCR5885384.1 hypothetical protein [Rhizobacter sp. J219]
MSSLDAGQVGPHGRLAVLAHADEQRTVFGACGRGTHGEEQQHEQMAHGGIYR